MTKAKEQFIEKWCSWSAESPNPNVRQCRQSFISDLDKLPEEARAEERGKIMRKTKCTGQTCVGELRLAALDVGFDLRKTGTPVALPGRFSSVGLNDADGETYLIEGTRQEMIDAIKAAGYTLQT